ncbi:MAG: hypothetical protein ACJ8GN_27900 [Longimicrobiaceae bacterium]
MTHRFARPLRWAFLCLAVGVIPACGNDGPTVPPTPKPSFVKLQSDPGDYIGAGRSYEYTKSNAVISVIPAGKAIQVSIDGDEQWSAMFEVPAASIQPGTYTGLERWPFHDPAKGGLAWGGEGRGCNTLTGSMKVDSIRYMIGGVAMLEMSFEQHCDGAAAALRGTIHYRADDATAPSGPVNPPPSNLWKPAAGAVPSAGNYIYLESPAGDYIGQGQTTTTTTGITVTSNGGHVAVGGGGWGGDFQAMNGLTQLKPGYYAGLERWPFHNPAKGGLSWDGNGRGCNTLSGWFVVDAVTYNGNSITALDLRFEQRCEGSMPPLHGAIHWHA